MGAKIFPFILPMRAGRTPSRLVYTEREIVELLLDDFEVDGSLGQKLTDQFDNGKEWTQSTLLTFAMVCSELANVKLPRAWRRNRRLIYKWLTDHYCELAPVALLTRVE
jgi:hypothetical protein